MQKNLCHSFFIYSHKRSFLVLWDHRLSLHFVSRKKKIKKSCPLLLPPRKRARLPPGVQVWPPGGRSLPPITGAFLIVWIRRVGFVLCSMCGRRRQARAKERRIIFAKSWMMVVVQTVMVVVSTYNKVMTQEHQDERAQNRERSPWRDKSDGPANNESEPPMDLASIDGSTVSSGEQSTISLFAKKSPRQK